MLTWISREEGGIFLCGPLRLCAKPCAADVGWLFERYDGDSSGRHLHLVAVLCPEVHLLQFRFRRSPSRIGKPLPRGAVKRSFIAHLAMDAGHSLPWRRNSQ